MKPKLSKIFILILIVALGIGLFLFSYQIFETFRFTKNAFLLQDVQTALIQNNTTLACSRLREVENKICEAEGRLVGFKELKGKKTIQVPAVNQEGEGVVANISVEIEKGEGRILFDIENVLEFYDTQDSARSALDVAKTITGKNLNDKDIIYSIHAPAPVVRGSSAGSAISIATIAAIENKTINRSVMITGQINHDGTIGLVSGVEAKARAAKENGVELFLVPLGQSQEVTYEERKHCRENDLMEWCKTEYVPVKKNLTEIVGIKVKEIGHLSEAVDLMLY